MSRILCVWSPNWAIETWRRRRPSAPRAEPFALVRQDRGLRVLAAVSPDAATAGLFPGQRVTDAQALRPGLVLAEAEPESLNEVVDAIVARRWAVEERMALDVRVLSDGDLVHRTWAVNEVAIEKRARERMIDVMVEVDGRPLSRWGCAGVVCAAPTGSTAYAFSAGGPVVWPEVAAMLVVPLSAHALFARPLVVSPRSVVAFDLGENSPAIASADGRRNLDVAGGLRIEVRQDPRPVRFARLTEAPFTDRLVAKFELPVDGWRGRRPEGG